jgi:quinoprotein glucose dehydrogenase
MIAQDASKHPGSIIRIHLDGSIPEDNPKFEGMADWLPGCFEASCAIIPCPLSPAEANM